MIPDAFVAALLTFVGVLVAALVAAGVAITVQLFKWKMENQRLWAWNRALQDQIYRGAAPPPVPAPPGLFD